ncbi:MAG: hypothetical protein CL946_03295 [Ectothiorhodospiraceae bacterium]|nr:hypothetical protein [Ectothiorhodospiraceae bacterium]
MKYFITILLLASSMFAQQWEQVFPPWEVNELHDVLWWNGDTVFSCGKNYSLLRSTNKGVDWTEVLGEREIGYDFVDMFRFGESIVLRAVVPVRTVIDYDPFEYKLFMYSVSRNEITSVSFPITDRETTKDMRVSVVGGNIYVLSRRYKTNPSTSEEAVLYYSSDAGNAWSERLLNPDIALYNERQRVCFVTKDTGFIVAYSYSNPGPTLRLFRTTDSATSWDLLEGSPELSGQVEVNYAGFSGNHFVYLHGSTAIYISTDYGDTWSDQRLVPWTTSVSSVIADIQWPEYMRMHVLGEGGDIYTSTDGGIEWDQVRDITALHVDRDYYATGLTVHNSDLIVSNMAGYFDVSHDDGATWDNVRYSDVYNIRNVRFYDRNNGTVVASNIEREDAVFTTTDGGGSFEYIGTMPQIEYYEVDICDKNTMYAYRSIPALQPNMYELSIWRSTNSGADWDSVYVFRGAADEILSSISCVDNYIFRKTNDSFFVSDDRGESWVLHPVQDTANTVSEAVPVRSSDGSIVLYTTTGSDVPGRNPRIYRSANLGEDWHVVYEAAESGSNITSLQVLSADTVAFVESTADAVGVYMTTNAGSSWGLFYSTSEAGKAKNYHLNPPYAYSMPSSGYLISTDDRFNTTQVSLFRSNRFSYRDWLFFADLNNGWLVTRDIVYATANGGVNSINPEQAAVQTMTLNVSYPNPVSAGASATVEFTLERAAAVTLEVHDILGRRVREQSLGHLPLGEHSQTISTTGLQSGMYFYTLTSGANAPVVGKIVVR